jgi:carbonic anhydrase
MTVTDPADDTFADLVAGNDSAAASYAVAAPDGRARRGLAVVTCMDARIDPLAVLGLRPGDALVVRTAGARVSDDVVGELMVAMSLLGVRRVAVMAHTGCRMTAADESVLHDAIRAAGGPDTTGLHFRTASDPETGVRADVAVLSSSDLLSGVAVGGFVLDLDSGRVRRVC